MTKDNTRNLRQIGIVLCALVALGIFYCVSLMLVGVIGHIFGLSSMLDKNIQPWHFLATGIATVWFIIGLCIGPILNDYESPEEPSNSDAEGD